MLKVLHFADTHLGFDFPLRPKIDIRRRGPDFFDNFHRILTYAERSRPDLLIHGGDLFFRSRVAAVITDKVYKKLFDFVSSSGIPIYIVPGNHERSSLPQSIYLAHPLIHIFNRPRHFCFEKGKLKVILHGFPFYRGNIRSCFKDLLYESGWWHTYGQELRLLILHQAVDGATVGPSDYTFRKRKDVINIHDIPGNATAVLCGHIHRRQILYSGHVPVIYPGSIERTSFAEKDEPKGFYELDFTHGSGENGHLRLTRSKFMRLPARDMVDLEVNGFQSKKALQEWLISKSAGLQQDSIVRLHINKTNGNNFPLPGLPFFRSILPSSFSLQMAVKFKARQYH